VSFPACAIQTSCSASPPTYQTFPSYLPKTACYADHTYSFALNYATGGGYNLELWYEPLSGASSYGLHWINSTLIVYVPGSTPTGDTQVYAGPNSFTVDGS
jgi:hypothetical protein